MQAMQHELFAKQANVPLAVDLSAKALGLGAYIAGDKEQKKSIRNNFAGEVGTALGGIGASKLMRSAAGASAKVDGDLYNKMVEKSPVDVRHGGLRQHAAEYVNLGHNSPHKPHVFIGNAMHSPAVLGHEIGHHEIAQSRVGRALQNEKTMAVAGASPAAGAVAGALSGLSDNEHVQRAGRLAPVALSAPELMYEGLASVKGLQQMRRAGANSGQLLRGAAGLLPAFGTYAARAGGGYFAARGAQEGVKAVRSAVSQEKTAELAGMIDELEKMSASRGSWSVSQTRSGRRSISVDKLIKKDNEGTLFKKTDRGEPVPEKSMADELAKLSTGVSIDEANNALARLRKLEDNKPSGGELLRNTIAGTGLGVGANLLSTAIKAGPFPRGVDLARHIAGAAIPGAVLGAGLPLARRKMDEGAEVEKLRAHLGVSRVNPTRSKIRQTLGVG